MSTQLRIAFSFLLLGSLILPVSSFAFETDLLGTTSSIGNGFTGGSHPEGSHFHSSNLAVLPAGNPPIVLPGVAEVGGFFGDEEIRGVSEFALGGPALNATLHFDVFDTFAAGLSPNSSGVDGLFGQGSFVGNVDVFPYAADNAENISDYEIAPLTALPILSIEVGPGTVVGGDTFSVDITDLYNGLVENGDQALGVRLQAATPDANAGAITFHNLRVNLEQAIVPEPSSSILVLSGMLMLLSARKRRG